MHPDTQRLLDELNRLTDTPTWREAAALGTELVDHAQSAERRLHLANGDIVEHSKHGWQLHPDTRDGITVISGTTHRIHNPGIDPTARIHPTASIDPTARIEAGVTIGHRTHIAAHAHVGRDTRVGTMTYVGPGAFIGPNTTVRDGNHVGEGAIIGAHSDIGTTSTTGAGATIAAETTIDANTVITAGDTTPGTVISRGRSVGAQAAIAVERLTTLNRE